mmetsp:Transcript_3277/g.4751  ORF Transcript_3277/g.4751 Transcript_3277/m.4751 type:complete len:94 (+) Transcript_3277:214-495(+)
MNQIGEVIQKTVGEEDYEVDNANKWTQIIANEVYNMNKKTGFKLSVLVEISPRKTDCVRRTKYLSLPGTDLVTMVEKKTAKLNVMVHCAVFAY